MNQQRSPCPWDPERLELATTPERAGWILDLLLQQGEKTLAVMQDAAGDDAVQQWRRAAHGLAGSALNLGMDDLAALCREDEASTATQAQRDMLREGIRYELARIVAYKHSL